MRQTMALPPSRLAGMIAVLSLFLGACAAVPEASAPAAEPEPAAEAPVSVQAVSVQPAAPVAPPQASPEFKPGAPERYVVQPGDTLWDLANTFLRDPWYWPEIWLTNPQIQNPHLIYPGDVLSIHYIEGQPRVTVTERLSPQIRVERFPDATFPIAALQPFMFRARVVDEDTLEQAPYIVAAQDERVIYGAGDRVYVRNAPEARQYDLYQLVRRDRILVDPDTGEDLGVATIPIGEAEIVRSGEIATAILRRSDREAIRGDRLIGFDPDPDLLFDISRPPEGVEGTVILLFDAISQVGTLQAVVINRGAREGIQNGQVFTAWEAGQTARDPIDRTTLIELPEEPVGQIMVFRTFEKVAYALVVESTRPIREGYRVRHP
ncbi:MAG TPA: LysM peptidoglycan-binding domain-containing protein [Thioalkalivibrio sp.]|nr:LysM peptidoglycan-binding domain-containing protein [Thioalkalivibrio sp.]